MKKTITIFAAIFFTCIYYDSFSQTYNGAFYELFFGRQPSARAEAMGRSIASIPGDALSYYYNPAGMASLQGLNLNGSFAGPYYILDKASYNFFGASYKIKKYGDAALSRDYFTYGEEVVITDESGNIIGTYDPHVTNYRLTLSSEVIKDLFIGANLNLLQPRFSSGQFTVGNETGSGNKDVFYFDLGVIKSFNIHEKKMKHSFNIGSSLINVNSAKYSSVDASQADKLPVIFRLGGSYNLLLDDKQIAPKLKSYNFLLYAEYEDLFNSKYFGGFNSGFEFTFLEILSLRGGYYTQKLNDYGYSSYNKDNLSEFTYGFGLNAPIRQLTNAKTPIEVKFDFTSLKQPSYSTEYDDWDNFYVYTIIFNWVF